MDVSPRAVALIAAARMAGETAPGGVLALRPCPRAGGTLGRSVPPVARHETGITLPFGGDPYNSKRSELGRQNRSNGPSLPVGPAGASQCRFLGPDTLALYRPIEKLLMLQSRR